MSTAASAASTIPFRIETVDRIPKQRYYDSAFFDLEVEQLWSRTWQMACRLEELPQPGDWVEYEILDQSVLVARQPDGSVRAFQNACRHRGVRVATGSGTAGAGFTCSFHGWCYAIDGANTAVTQRRSFAEHNLAPGELDLTPVRCESWGGCAWINLSDEAPPLRECLAPFTSMLDEWRLASMRAEKWVACRLPVNWKLAEEAFVEQYHVIESHPQLVIPGRYPPKNALFDPATFVQAELHYLRMMSDGMAGMVDRSDVLVAERLAERIKLPTDPAVAIPLWNRELNAASTAWHRERGHDMPDVNALDDAGLNNPFFYAFPHFFVLPMYSGASSYRFRPLGPEETLMEIWSLARFAPGEEPGPLPVPEWWAPDDERFPAIPRQDFSNLPRQQQGLHARGFEFMRLSAKNEGHISNYHRVIDGFLAGLPYERLLPALQSINVFPLEMPIVEFEF